MNKNTKLGHSGLMVETDGVLLVYDCNGTSIGKVVKTLKHNPELPVVFFVSSRRHYDKEIMNIGQNHRRLYFISNDVVDRDLHHDQPVNWVSPGDTFENQLGGITVKAGKDDSGDKACTFVVTTADGREVTLAPETELSSVSQ